MVNHERTRSAPERYIPAETLRDKATGSRLALATHEPFTLTGATLLEALQNVTVNPNPNPFSLVSLGFLSFSFLGFFLFVYGPTLERCLYRPEIGPYMVWFYIWTRPLLISLLIRFLDDIFWFGYLVSL